MGKAGNIANNVKPDLSQALGQAHLKPGQNGPQGGKETILFAKVLQENQMMSQELIKSFGLGMEGAKGIQSVSASNVNFDPSKASSVANPELQIQSMDKVGNLLAEVNRGQLQMEGIMEIALSGRKFNPSELLAMQAGVYQIAQEMELTSKVFEQVNSAHKTLWNANFQG